MIDKDKLCVHQCCTVGRFLVQRLKLLREQRGTKISLNQVTDSRPVQSVKRHDEITEWKWFLCFVVSTSAKVTLTYDMHAKQMQLTLRSSSFWTLQLKETHCIKFGESRKEMMNWFPQQLLTHWYIFCPKVFLSYSVLFAIMLHYKIYWWNNSRII